MKLHEKMEHASRRLVRVSNSYPIQMAFCHKHGIKKATAKSYRRWKMRRRKWVKLGMPLGICKDYK